MMIRNLLLANESYTHKNWVYRDVYVGFSRLYYILDGEAYYEENGQRIRLKKGYLYLTPVKKCFTLYENPQNKLLHTYAHVTTVPAVERLMEIPVEGNPLLGDAVSLWRKYTHEGNEASVLCVLQFLLSCLETGRSTPHSLAERVRRYVDSLGEFSFCMGDMSRDLGYSREHLTRCFWEAYHVTPYQYFHSPRMSAALEKLQVGESVTKIAEELRFSSPYAFSKAFKGYFGCSPSGYRSLLQEDQKMSDDFPKMT